MTVFHHRYDLGRSPWKSEPAPPVVTQPQPQEPEVEIEPEPIRSEIVTSETGREIYIEEEEPETEVEPVIEPVSTAEPVDEPLHAADPEPEAHVQSDAEPDEGDTDASGTGTGIVGDIEEAPVLSKSQAWEKRKLRHHLLRPRQPVP